METDTSTDAITASRSIWMAVLELSRQTSPSVAEKIASVSITRQDFETSAFLAMHLKLILGVRRAVEQETAEKLTGDGKAEEADVEIDLTLAEATYLSLVIRIADFKGCLSFKKNLWRIIANLATKGAQA